MPADFDPHPTPVTAKVQAVEKLSAGEGGACAIHKDGGVTCWGSNVEGELGIGRQSPTEPPTKVPGLSQITDLCFASLHSCAKNQAGDMYCWGGNASGQLGDGTKERRLSPTKVAW